MNNSPGPHNISDWFWNILAQADRDPDKLLEILTEFDYHQLSRFEYEYRRAAGYLFEVRFLEHMEGTSEDDIEDLTRWIVGKGKDYYFEIWNHPERTPSVVANDGQDLSSIAWKVLINKYASIPADFGETSD